MLTPEDAAKVGGSDVAALVGLSPWATPLTVYARVVGGHHEESNATLRRGNLMEPVVRAMYQEDTGAELLGGLKLTHPRFAYGRASLDDVVRLPGGGRRVLEVKTCWPTEVGGWGPAGTDEVPDYYACQVAYYLGTGLEAGVIDEAEADVAALLLGVEESPRVYRVRHDADVYAWLLESVERFWRDHVVPRRPPPPTNPAREAEAVRRLYRAEREPLAPFEVLSPEERAAVLAYAEARRMAAHASAALADAEVRLKLALGWRAGVESLPPDCGLARVTWTSDRQGKVSWKAAYDALARETGAARELVQSVAEQHRGEPGRTLRATETKEEPCL